MATRTRLRVDAFASVDLGNIGWIDTQDPLPFEHETRNDGYKEDQGANEQPSSQMPLSREWRNSSHERFC